MSDLVENLKSRREVEIIDGWPLVHWEDKEAIEAAYKIEELLDVLYHIAYEASYVGLYSEGWAREYARNALKKEGIVE